MAYTKMTVDDFKARLKNGDYKDATGARRGAGKADLTASEKEQCRKLIDKHFGVDSSSPAPKKTAKKAKGTSKKVVAKKAATNGKAEHKSNGASAAPAKKTAGKGRKRRSSEAADGSESELLAGLHLAKERIGTITQAVDTMKRAKETYPELDTKEGMTVAAQSLTEIMQGVHASLKERLTLPDAPTAPAIDPSVVETLAKTAPAAVGLPGHESPVQLPPNDAQVS